MTYDFTRRNLTVKNSNCLIPTWLKLSFYRQLLRSQIKSVLWCVWNKNEEGHLYIWILACFECLTEQSLRASLSIMTRDLHNLLNTLVVPWTILAWLLSPCPILPLVYVRALFIRRVNPTIKTIFSFGNVYYFTSSFYLLRKKKDFLISKVIGCNLLFSSAAHILQIFISTIWNT